MNRAASPIHPFSGENVPGHAGILPAAKLRKTLEIKEDDHER
ncbi:hypothetical protein Tco_0832189, partial [Tanacetum coccineum]